MKKYFALMLAAILTFVGCQKEQPVATTLSVNIEEVMLASGEDVAEIVVTTNAESWSAKTDDEWLTLVMANDGKTFLIKATANPGESERAGSVLVRAGDKSVTINVVQNRKEIAEYTFMLYGCGGETLDGCTTYEFLINLLGDGCTDKINSTALYKYSACFQAGGDYNAGMKLDGTRRFAAPADGTFKFDEELLKAYRFDFPDAEEKQWMVKASQYLEPYSEKIGEADYNLSDPKSLTDFINWTVEKYPAKKYVLIFRNHGGGWDFYTDTQPVSTKAQMFDDNLEYNKGKKCLTIGNTVEGIKNSTIHKVDAIVFAECLMATMENLGECASVTDKCLAALETSYGGMSGDLFYKAVDNGLKNNASLDVILKEYADEYIKRYDIHVSDDVFYTDFGLYDLTKISTLYAPVKDIAKFFVDMETAANVDWRYVKHEAVANTLFAQSLYDSNDNKNRTLLMDVRKRISNWASLTDEEIKQLMTDIAKVNEDHYGYCVYDFMAKVVSIAEKYTPTVNPDAFKNELETVKGYMTAYDKALKDMAYITCTQKSFENEPYQYTSPSVQLLSLNKDVYKPLSADNIYGYYWADMVSRESALAAYKALAFDKATNWSSFLESLLKSGTAMEGPDRRFVHEGK